MYTVYKLIHEYYWAHNCHIMISKSRRRSIERFKKRVYELGGSILAVLIL